jgi:membrane-associated protease RseP (regulator of RpoE activity)
MNGLALVGIAIFFFGLVASIALHEVGHLVPAKLFGVRVTQYMVGFGRTVWSRRRGETEYGVKAIPLGGFIRMIGMLPPEAGADPGKLRMMSTGPFQALISDARKASKEEIGPDDGNRVFYLKKWWQKLIIMLGGPAMNVLLAMVLAGGVLMTFGNPDKPILSTTVSSVSECVIPAQEERTNCLPSDPPAPAADAGVLPGDQLISIDGLPLAIWEDAQLAIRDRAGQTVEIVVDRDGEQLLLATELATAEMLTLDSTADEQEYETVGFLGVSPTIVDYETEGPIGVLTWTGDFMGRTAEAVARIPSRMVDVWEAAFGGAERGLDTPMSIVGAGRIGGEIASADGVDTGSRIATFVMLLASFNMAIALFNLIPLLPLDGGHAAGAIWEGIKRGGARVLRRPAPRPVDVAKALPLAYAMAAVLLGMGVLLIYADIVNPVSLFG